MNKYFREFFDKWGKKEKALLKGWLDIHDNSVHSLLEILRHENLRGEFKIASIIILTSPSLVRGADWRVSQLLPDWQMNFISDNNANVLHELSEDFNEIIAKLSKELFRYFGEIILENINLVSNISELSPNIRYKISKKYDEFVIQLLAALDEDDDLACELFKRYKLSDMEEFDKLLVAKVHNSWKEKARKKALGWIKIPPKGVSSPICFYVGLIKYLITNNESRSDAKSSLLLLVSADGFEKYNEALFFSWEVPKFMSIIDGDDYMEARRKLTRQIVLGNKNTGEYSFQVFDENQEWAKSALKEFSADEELCDRLKMLISVFNEKKIFRSNYEKEMKRKEEKLLSEMVAR